MDKSDINGCFTVKIKHFSITDECDTHTTGVFSKLNVNKTYNFDVKHRQISFFHTPAIYKQYSSEINRISSFKNWPMYLYPSPDILVQAGFFYTNTGDIVRCYCCGIQIKNWKPEDNPWLEHEALSPNCVFVKLEKTEDSLCCVCNKKETSSIFLPCGHSKCCSICSTVVETCPFCQTKIVELIRTKSGFSV